MKEGKLGPVTDTHALTSPLHLKLARRPHVPTYPLTDSTPSADLSLPTKTFPLDWRGGPMFWAETEIGLPRLLSAIRRYQVLLLENKAQHFHF